MKSGAVLWRVLMNVSLFFPVVAGKDKVFVPKVIQKDLLSKPEMSCFSTSKVCSGLPVAALSEASPWCCASVSFPLATRRSATAPLKAFATLAIRMWSVARGFLRASTSATPALSVVMREPRRSVTIAPGGPPSAATRASSWR